MKTLRSQTFQILKRLYMSELIFVADKLSQDRKKWSYDKRSKISVTKAIASNVKEEELAQVLKQSLGERTPYGDTFPEALQFQKIVFGPLGFLESVVKRSRYDAEAVADIFTKYVKGDNPLEKVVRESRDKIPKDVLQSVIDKQGISNRSMLTQLVLAYLSDKEICNLVNELLAKEIIKIDISGLYEDIEYPWIITRYGLALLPRGEPINNLVNIVKEHYGEEDLEPELRAFSGDFSTKLLEYCIMESPEVILQRLFGLPSSRRIAKELGFVSDKIEKINEVVALILLGLGFNVPPTLTGATAYLNNIQKFKRDLSDSRDVGVRSGIMSRVFVEMERILRDLAYFYTTFLWSEQLDNLESAIETEMVELTPKQVKMKALDFFVRKKFRIKKPFERLGFGDFIGLITTVNKTAQKARSLKKKMNRAFGRTWILENKHIKVLENISPYRSSFTHTKDYPGDEKCDEIGKLIENLIEEIRLRKIYPIVMRISREISDEYGKRYAECIDENGNRWLVYTDEYLDTSRPYFVHSKTSNIAVNPVIVEKIF